MRRGGVEVNGQRHPKICVIAVIKTPVVIRISCVVLFLARNPLMVAYGREAEDFRMHMASGISWDGSSEYAIDVRVALCIANSCNSFRSF
jgi:hypothetical protein